MAKCQHCNKGGLFRKTIKTRDNIYICSDCSKSLGIDSSSLPYMNYSEIKYGMDAYRKYRAAKSDAQYFFLVHPEDDKQYKVIEKYQKDMTDKEDIYSGYSLRDLKESDLYDEKVWKYPPLDVDVELTETALNGKPAIAVNLIRGIDDSPLIGYAPTTKVKKILSLLKDHNCTVSAELYGGDFRRLLGDGYVEDGIPTLLNVRVILDWSSEISIEDIL